MLILTSSSSSKSLSTSGRFSGTVCVSAIVSSRLGSFQLKYKRTFLGSPSHHHELEVLLEAQLPQLHGISCSFAFHLQIEHKNTSQKILFNLHGVLPSSSTAFAFLVERQSFPWSSPRKTQLYISIALNMVLPLVFPPCLSKQALILHILYHSTLHR